MLRPEKYLEEKTYKGVDLKWFLRLLEDGTIKERSEELPPHFDYIGCATFCFEDIDGSLYRGGGHYGCLGNYIKLTKVNSIKDIRV